MVGYIIYLFDDVMGVKFGCVLKIEKFNYDLYSVEFQVESYLCYQGEEFFICFDVNIYLLMIKVLDYFDFVVVYGDDLVCILEGVEVDFCLMFFIIDWCFLLVCLWEIVDVLIVVKKNVSYLEIDVL